jgi:hypothetical protein
VATHGSTLGGGLITVNVTGTWAWEPPALHTMHLLSTITGSYGCPGAETPLSASLPGPSGSDGLSSSNSDGIFDGDATCPGGAIPTATFTVSASLAPGG